MNPPTFDDAFLARQQDYYCTRAAEYDEWWERRGRYDHDAAENAAWFRERAVVEAAIDAAALTGEVLELACGTGYWTARLARHATVTALDGSAEMLALAAARPGNENVTFRQADLFAWQPDRQYDALFMGFWLSHVPPERLTAFLQTVCSALKPKGRIAFVDSQPDPITTSADQPLPSASQPWLTRRLNDGREFSIVKVFYQPQSLQECFRLAHLTLQAEHTPRFFLYGVASRD